MAALAAPNLVACGSTTTNDEIDRISKRMEALLVRFCDDMMDTHTRNMHAPTEWISVQRW
jgi:hypothetical protein